VVAETKDSAQSVLDAGLVQLLLEIYQGEEICNRITDKIRDCFLELLLNCATDEEVACIFLGKTHVARGLHGLLATEMLRLPCHQPWGGFEREQAAEQILSAIKRIHPLRASVESSGFFSELLHVPRDMLWAFLRTYHHCENPQESQ